MSTQSNGTSVMLQGRIVWGLGQNLSEGQLKKDQQTKTVIIDPATGQGTVEYGFGLAVLKVDPRTNQWSTEYQKAYQALHGEAMTMFPSGQIPPQFAMKYKDGDTAVDEQGRPYSQREGHANHIIISCTTQIPIKFFKWDGQQNVLVTNGVKVGDYVNVQLNIKAHPAVGRGKAGLYTNPSAVQLIAEGKAIINTPSGDQLFGQAPPSYVGQVEAPVIGQMPNVAPAPQAYAPAPQMPGQAPAAPQYAQPPVQHDPHYGVLPQHHQPVAPQQNVQAPPQQGTMAMPTMPPIPQR